MKRTTPTAPSRLPPDNCNAKFGPSAFLTPAEVGHHLRRSARWSYHRIASGELEASKLCGRLVISRANFEKFIAQNIESYTPPPKRKPGRLKVVR